jgi:saccharopine dehydrogenase-like NADP-dependent oxidoreductase
MKPSLLIVGCGDVARRAMPALSRHYRVLAASHDQ